MLIGYESSGGPLKALEADTYITDCVGWKASQKKNSFLKAHGNCIGKHDIWPPYVRIPQHALSTKVSAEISQLQIS